MTTEKKKCSKCGEEKSLCEFHMKVSKTQRRDTRCKLCEKKRSKKDYEGNKEASKEKAAKYYIANKEYIDERNKTWSEKNREKRRVAERKWEEKNRDKIRARKRKYQKQRRKNVQAKLEDTLRKRVSGIVKKKCRAGSAVRDLGCTIEYFKKHLEERFYNRANGEKMIWDNYGMYGWHIDHIIPLASFDLTDRAQFLKACHYTNMQPLWAEENYKKSDKTEGNEK